MIKIVEGVIGRLVVVAAVKYYLAVFTDYLVIAVMLAVSTLNVGLLEVTGNVILTVLRCRKYDCRAFVSIGGGSVRTPANYRSCSSALPEEVLPEAAVTVQFAPELRVASLTVLLMKSYAFISN